MDLRILAMGICFGEKSFHVAVQQVGINNLAQQACKAVYDYLAKYQNGAPPFGDIALLAV
jgi:hypothetical protein